MAADAERQKVHDTIYDQYAEEVSLEGAKLGTAGPIAIQWSVHVWPTIYVIDAKGVIRFKDVRGEELDNAIAQLLAELGHEVKIVHEHNDEK